MKHRADGNRSERVVLGTAMLFVVLGSVLLSSCGNIKSIADALAGLKRCEFRLASVSDARISGISLVDKRSLGDFKPLTEGVELLQAYRNKQFFLDCVLNVEIRNPNTGQDGTRRADAHIKGLDFRLLVDDRVTITGDILKPLTVPATGETVTMPVAVRVDIQQFFRDKGYDELLKLILAVAGADGSASRLTLDVRPTVETPLGEMTYPERIKVVSKEFRN